MASVSATCTFSSEATVTVSSSSILGTEFSVVVRFGTISGLARSAPLASSIIMGNYIKNEISMKSNKICNYIYIGIYLL